MKSYPTEALSDGWKLQRYDMRTWTQYVIYRDRGDGFHDGHHATFCRKRDAMAYMDKAIKDVTENSHDCDFQGSQENPWVEICTCGAMRDTQGKP